MTEVAARDLRDQYKRLGVIFERSGKTALQTEYEVIVYSYNIATAVNHNRLSINYVEVLPVYFVQKVETSLHNRPGKNICVLPVNKPKNRYTDMEMLPCEFPTLASIGHSSLSTLPCHPAYR